MKFSLLKSVFLIWKQSGRTLLKSKAENNHYSLKAHDNWFLKFQSLFIFINNHKLAMHSMNPSIVPPSHVKGMTTLAREAFLTTVKIPGIKVPKQDINTNQKMWKSCLFKMRGLKPMAELEDSNPQRETHQLILLDPDKLHADTLTQQQQEWLQKYGFDLVNPSLYDIELQYENWSSADIFKAVLPAEAENVSSFSQVGHIAHLNLKPESLPFKKLIGEVLIDKISTVKTVVNKLSAIDNTYRNFQMELLAGENNFITRTKEHSCTFEMDFSKVYWNPRLSSEHQRIVDYIPYHSVVYDVCAGIGPFAIPLAKKKQCRVWANDLNPHSYEYLNKNIQLNKVNSLYVKTFNMDARAFIQTVLKPHLVNRMKNIQSNAKGLDCKDNNVAADDHIFIDCKSFILMNLPAMAVEFLSEFESLLQDLPESCRDYKSVTTVLPEVLCYAFTSKTKVEAEVKARAETYLGQPLPDNFSCRIVRNVAPNKEMVCFSFQLWPDLVLKQKIVECNECLKREATCLLNNEGNEPEPKRVKT